jgi:hypothetical protein
MLIDRYPKEDIFVRVPKMIQRIDPVLQPLDRLLDDDELYRTVPPRLWQALSLHAGTRTAFHPS